jgi:hypothetical protein
VLNGGKPVAWYLAPGRLAAYTEIEGKWATALALLQQRANTVRTILIKKGTSMTKLWRPYER